MSVIACPTCGKKNRIPDISKGIPACGNCQAKLPWIVNATDTSFDKAAHANLPVLVDLWAPWCGPCKMVAPVLERIAVKYSGRLKILKVNVDENPLIQSRYQAMSIPTMLLLRSGEVVARQVGAMSQLQLEQWLANNQVNIT